MEGGYLLDWQALHEAYLVAAGLVAPDDPRLPALAAERRSAMPQERPLARAWFRELLGTTLARGSDRCPHGLPIGVDLALPEPHAPTHELIVGGTEAELPVARHALRLLCGPAMGSGRSPWTRACLRLLERQRLEGARVLDVGSGTGILGLYAAKRGAAQVDAVDEDPLAASVADWNARQNGLPHRFHAIVGGPECLRGGYDVAIVALNGIWQVPLAVEAVRPRLAPGGTLIASPAEGSGESVHLAETLESMGFAGLDVLEVEDWFAIAARRV